MGGIELNPNNGTRYKVRNLIKTEHCNYEKADYSCFSIWYGGNSTRKGIIAPGMKEIH